MQSYTMEKTRFVETSLMFAKILNTPKYGDVVVYTDTGTVLEPVINFLYKTSKTKVSCEVLPFSSTMIGLEHRDTVFDMLTPDDVRAQLDLLIISKG
jgi:hypothetical protein